MPAILSAFALKMWQQPGADRGKIPVPTTPTPMPSNTYELMRQAILTRQPVVCRYKGHVREVCPYVLGMTNRREMVQVWQYAGGTSSQKCLPPGGEWRCMHVDEITMAALKPGPWHEPPDHRWEQTCVAVIDVEVPTPPRDEP